MLWRIESSHDFDFKILYLNGPCAKNKCHSTNLQQVSRGVSAKKLEESHQSFQGPEFLANDDWKQQLEQNVKFETKMVIRPALTCVA